MRAKLIFYCKRINPAILKLNFSKIGPPLIFPQLPFIHIYFAAVSGYWMGITFDELVPKGGTQFFISTRLQYLTGMFTCLPAGRFYKTKALQGA
jgi:hypothetical protein